MWINGFSTKSTPLKCDCWQRDKRMSKRSIYSDPWDVFMFPKLKISFNGYNLLLCNDIQGRGIKSSGTLRRTDWYSRINNTKFPASGAGNNRERRLMSPIRESARSRVRVDQCVSVVWMVDAPVLVCLRRRCNHMTKWVTRTEKFARFALKVVMQNDGDFVDVNPL